MANLNLTLRLRRWRLTLDSGGHAIWTEELTSQAIPASKTGLLICDMWDKHWSRGATERVDRMAPHMDQVVRTARSRGVQIIHAPSDTMAFYQDTKARRRVLDVPAVEPPVLRQHPDPPLPIDASDEGSDTGETEPYRAWSRQHPAIAIDQEVDAISDDGPEVYSFLQHRGIEQLLIMGVHTNMCVLNRSFAIKQMIKWGMAVALVRDLTDAMYNPARPPYVSHDQGTDLVIGYIEKFWCPSVTSDDLLDPLH